MRGSVESYPRATVERAMKTQEVILRAMAPVTTVEQVLKLYRERSFDLNVLHFHEKLEQEHQIQLSYTWVKQALQGAGRRAKSVTTVGIRNSRPVAAGQKNRCLF